MTSESKRAVFFDRDGVINECHVRDGKPYPPKNASEFKFCAGVIEGIKALKQKGFLIFIATNQPDITTGKTTQAIVDEMHAYIQKTIPEVEKVFVCIHTDSAKCECRKPKAGMLLDAARAWNIDLKRSFMIGDRWRDIGAGKAAGCTTIFIDYQYAEDVTQIPDHTVDTPAAAIKTVLSQN